MTSSVSETVEYAPKRVKAAILRVLATSAHPKLEVPNLAHRYNMSVDDVKAIATMHGGIEQPSRMLRAAAVLEGKADEAVAPAPAPAPRPQQPDIPTPTGAKSPTSPVAASDLAGLLERAGRSTKKRTRDRGARLQQLVEQLKGDVDAEEKERREAERVAREKAAAAEKVARLERELAAARAALRGDKATPAAAASAEGPSAAEIRAWAKSADVACPATGRVPAAVREQYLAAQAAS
jgi:hypothetical protein